MMKNIVQRMKCADYDLVDWNNGVRDLKTFHSQCIFTCLEKRGGGINYPNPATSLCVEGDTDSTFLYMSTQKYCKSH